MNAEQEFLQETDARFERACHSIAHSLNQLNDEQLWLRPTPHVNSIGIILQHLRGNLRHADPPESARRPDSLYRPSDFRRALHPDLDAADERTGRGAKKIRRLFQEHILTS